MSEPYYRDDQVTLYLGDCREVPEWLSADVLVTDPPYGMAYVSNFRTASAKAAPIAGDEDPDLRDAVLSQWPASRPAVVFGTWRVPPPPGEVQRLVWWKRNAGPGMGNLAMPWGTAHEEVYILGAGWDRTKAGVRRVGSVVTTDAVMGGSDGLVARYEHPTAKPVALLESLIAACPPGVVADPFAGSGTTLVAARNLGRMAIGVELDEAYCEVIAKRLAQDCLPLGAM